MKRYPLFAAILPVLLIALAGFCLRSAKGRPSTKGAATGFAVVELFTSEGCSSCPPADEVLAKVAAEYKDNVYVMGFHVDYWDKLGWKDAYSSAAYTRRQQEYAQAFRLSSIYTPEAVVNGEKELVGSDERALRSIIEEDLRKAGGKKIVLQAGSDGKNIKVSYQITGRGDDILYIALVQSHAETRVGAGENSGRRLEHINIVRDLVTAPAGNSGSMDLAIPQGLHAKDCQVIAFLQKSKSGNLSLTGAGSSGIL